MKQIKDWFLGRVLQTKKGRSLELSNGEAVLQPFSFTTIVWLILFVLTAIAWQSTNIDIEMFIRRYDNFFDILRRMNNPNWSYLQRVQKPMLDTIQMSFLGSLLGSVLALPVAFIASSNINRNNMSLTIIRLLLSIFRTLPVLVYAALLSLVLGFGTLAGTVAIMIFTFTLMTKLLYEVIETIDMGAYEAIESTGATKAKAFVAAVIPQISAAFLSLSLYAFEINIRFAAILGWVGAGGIGLLMDDRMSWRAYNDLFVILVVLFTVVVFIEQLSRYFRTRLG
jgi:phosphonate transport system permease protein